MRSKAARLPLVLLFNPVTYNTHMQIRGKKQDLDACKVFSSTCETECCAHLACVTDNACSEATVAVRHSYLACSSHVEC